MPASMQARSSSPLAPLAPAAPRTRPRPRSARSRAKLPKLGVVGSSPIARFEQARSRGLFRARQRIEDSADVRCSDTSVATAATIAAIAGARPNDTVP